MLLRVENLSIEYGTGEGRVAALSDASLSLAAGTTLGIVGESGCGKTTLALGLLDLLPRGAGIAGGRVVLDGGDLARLDAEARRRLRWTRIAYVPQGAANALDPVRTIWSQLRRIARAHRQARPADLRRMAEGLFERVQLAPRFLDAYPHQLSGGMRQRALIAMALLFKPALLVADEPTTGLDVIVQRQVLQVLRRLQVEERMAMILVSHDLGVIAETSQRVAVVYAGRIVESGPARSVLDEPAHPYTMGLRRSAAEGGEGEDEAEREFVGIAGAPPRLDRPAPGCAFAPRCPFVKPRCHAEAPPERELGDRRVACHYAEEAPAMRRVARRAATWRGMAAP